MNRIQPLENMIAPGSYPFEYIPRALSGFFVFPSSDGQPQGWGAPFVSSDGSYIPPPGSPGGENPYKYISRSSGVWEIKLGPGDFIYGNIDWKGKRKYPGAQPPRKERFRLSYLGSPLRYFSTDQFKYQEGDLAQEEVYMDGLIAAIAPGPVLGAALRVLGSGPTEETYIIVVVKSGLSDEVYYKRFNGPVGKRENRLDPEFRRGEKALFNEKDNPGGWVLGFTGVLEFTPVEGTITEVVSPGTGWFFNESGTKAVCSRELKIEFNNLLETVTETTHGMVDMDLGSLTGITVTTRPVVAPFLVQIEIKRKHEDDVVYNMGAKGDYNLGPATPKEDHWWRPHSCKLLMTMSGSRVIAADFDGDTLIDFTLVVKSARIRNQYMYEGRDLAHGYGPPDPNPNGLGLNPNTGMWLGKYYDPGRVSPTREEDGSASYWLMNDDYYNLELGTGGPAVLLYRCLSGSATFWNSGVSNPEDRILYFNLQRILHPHFLDARDFTSSYAKNYVVQMYMENPLRENLEEYETFEDGTGGEPIEVYLFQKQETVGPAYAGLYRPGYEYGWLVSKWDGGWRPLIEEMKSVYKSFECKWLVDPNWPADEPNFWEGCYNNRFFSSEKTIFPRPSITDVLKSNEFSYRQGGLGRDDFGNVCLSFKYFDKNKDDYAYYNFLSQGDLTSLCGAGDRFYPIGVV